MSIPNTISPLGANSTIIPPWFSAREYIRSIGLSRIETDIDLDENYEVELRVRMNDLSTSNSYIWGTSGSTMPVSLISGNNNNGIFFVTCLYFAYSFRQDIPRPIMPIGMINDIQMDSSGAVMNGVKYLLPQPSVASPQTGPRVCFFGVRDRASSTFIGDIFSGFVLRKQTTTHVFLTGVDLRDNRPCLLDKSRGIAFYNTLNNNNLIISET